MNPSDRQFVATEEFESLVRMSDAEWEEAASRVEKAVAQYEHVDFGKLADDVVDHYMKAKADAEAAKRLPYGFPVTGLATATTAGMISGLVGGHSDKGRLQAAWMSALGFLAPLLALLAIVYGWHSGLGWYGVSRTTLLAGFCGFLALSLLLLASFVRGGVLVRVLSKQAALSVSVGALGATLLSPLAIRELRSNESTKLTLASSDLSLYMVDALASAEPSPIRRVAYLAETQDNYGLVDDKIESNIAVSIQARGLPGHLTAKVDSPGSGRVTWSQPLRPEITKTLIKQGRVEVAPTGEARLVTRDGSYAVSHALLTTVPSQRLQVVALIDAKTRMVTRVVAAPRSATASAAMEGSAALTR